MTLCPHCGKGVFARVILEKDDKETSYGGLKFPEKVGPQYHRSETGGSKPCKFCGNAILWDNADGQWTPINPDGTAHRCRSK